MLVLAQLDGSAHTPPPPQQSNPTFIHWLDLMDFQPSTVEQQILRKKKQLFLFTVVFPSTAEGGCVGPLGVDATGYSVRKTLLNTNL